MGFNWVSQKAVLLLRSDAVIDDLTICAVLFQLCSAFFKRSSAPELRTNFFILVQNLLLFEQLSEHNVEREYGHDNHHGENRDGDWPAFFKRRDKTELCGGLRCGTSRGQKQNRHLNYLSKNRTI
jgi:hypothetical protein